MQDVKSKQSKGLVCTACGGRKFKVIYTRATEDGLASAPTAGQRSGCVPAGPYPLTGRIIVAESL